MFCSLLVLYCGLVQIVVPVVVSVLCPDCGSGSCEFVVVLVVSSLLFPGCRLFNRVTFIVATALSDDPARSWRLSVCEGMSGYTVNSQKNTHAQGFISNRTPVILVYAVTLW